MTGHSLTDARPAANMEEIETPRMLSQPPRRPANGSRASPTTKAEKPPTSTVSWMDMATTCLFAESSVQDCDLLTFAAPGSENDGAPSKNFQQCKLTISKSNACFYVGAWTSTVAAQRARLRAVRGPGPLACSGRHTCGGRMLPCPAHLLHPSSLNHQSSSGRCTMLSKHLWIHAKASKRTRGSSTFLHSSSHIPTMQRIAAHCSNLTTKQHKHGLL